MFGCLAWSVSNQGMNIVLNIFFGPAINAARAIALQVSATIDRFSSSLITAAAPQIIKSYAEKDINYMTSIIEKVSKFSFLCGLYQRG
jgi:O-antigen/teichoic acid export membrane protein